MAPVFVATFVAVQWPFADFLMTPWARLVFATDRMAYMIPPVVQERWYRLEPADNLLDWPRDRDRSRLSLLLARAVVGRVDGQGATMISRAAGTWHLLRMLVIGLALTVDGPRRQP